MALTDDINRFIRPEFQKMEPYVPIEPTDVLSERLAVPDEDIIKLDGNENPYGCSPSVNRALADCSCYHLYPDPEQRQLRKALEEYTGVSFENIIVGAGSDELIDLVLRLFLQSGDSVINCPPTFGMYRFSTEVCGGRVIDIPRRDDFSIDIAAIKQIADERTKVIFIASPNNPSGNVSAESEISELLSMGVVIIIDEAYIEFSGSSLMGLFKQYPNLILLRTFSKWAGLAGLRVGYGFFPTQLVPYLMKIKQPYNINIAAQIAALASLNDIDFLRGTIKAIIDERERLAAKLSTFGWLKLYPSQANFILCQVLNGDAKQIHKNLQAKGIFIRYFDTPLLQNFIRISVGKPEHTDAVIAALPEIC